MLNKDTVSLNIANSLDQKTDEKLIQPDKLAGLKNRRFKKFGTTDKRPGQLALSAVVSTSYPNALAIATPTNRNTLGSLRNQLTLENRGAFYARQDDENQWKFVNHSAYAGVESKSIYSGDSQAVTVDSASVGGFTVVASLQSSAQHASVSSGTADIVTASLRYSVIDNSTGIYIAKNALIESFGSSSASEYIRVLSVSAKIFVIYAVSTNLKIVEVTPLTGALGSITTLKTDVINGYARGVFDAITVNTSTALGSVIVCAYPRTNDVNIMLIDSNGSALALPTNVNTAEKNYDGISLFTDPVISLNRFYLAYQTDLTDNPIRSVAYDISASSLTPTYALKTITTTTKIYNSFAHSRNPISGDVVIFFDSYGDSFSITGASPRPFYNLQPIEAALDYAEITPTGTITTALGAYSVGLRIAAKPFVDISRSTILIPCAYDSAISSSFMLCDFLYGKTPKTFFAVAKWYDGKAEAPKIIPTKLGNIYSTHQASSTEFSFFSICREALLGKTDYSQNGAIPPPIQFQPIVEQFGLFDYGTAKHTIKLDVNSAHSSIAIGEAQLSAGGFLQNYDGSTMAEKNYFAAPEVLWADVNDYPIRFTFVNGTVSTAAVTTFISGPGALWALLSISNGGTTPQMLLDYPGGGTARLRIYFIIDGVGAIPAAGGYTLVRVDVLSTDSPAQIVEKLKTATAPYNYISTDIQGTSSTGDTLIFQLSADGSVTTTTYNNFDISVSSGLTAGSYQYTCVWRWVDEGGKIHRSAPATPVTVNASTFSGSAPGYGGVNVICPPLTNKPAGDCSIEFYRTLQDGTVFHLLPANQTRQYMSLPWDPAGSRVYLIDLNTDEEIADNEILYTQGGVLPNYGIGQVTMACAHQKRAVVATEDPTQLLFSKTMVDGQPVEFALENEIRVNNDDARTSGIASLDDKLIIGKSDKIYVVAGEYPNDLGTQSTLSQPQQIAGDTGIENQSSIVLYPDGIIFKSKKGFYRLSRALQVDYVGMAVEEYNSFTVSRGVLDKTNNEINYFFQDSSDKIIYNYLQDKWAVWSNASADDACNHQDAIYRVEHSGKVHKQVEGTFQDIDGVTSAYYTSEVELPWLKLKGIQDFQRIYMAALIGTYKSPHTMVATFTYDYDTSITKSYSVASSTIVNGVLLSDLTYQWEIQPEIQKCMAIKIKFVETPVSGSGESLKMTDVSFEVGLKRGLNKVKAAKRA